MLVDLIKVQTSDGLFLDGFVSKPFNRYEDIAVLHVHGAYGNFFENFFLHNISESLRKIGVTFVSIGTRGRDYYADFKSISNKVYKSLRIGGTNEIFQECIFDIDAWYNYINNIGCSKIVLQGHSLGAMKVIYYIKEKNPKIKGVILLSPPDNYGLQYQALGDNFNYYLKYAKMQKSDNNLMPSDSYYEQKTPSAYLSLFEKNEDSGMFYYDNPDLMSKAGMDKIHSPLLVVFGSINEAVVDDLKICINSIKKSLNKNVDLVSKIINGANHNYHFYEKELSNQIISWIKGKILFK